jgi:hypothetical protein
MKTKSRKDARRTKRMEDVMIDDERSSEATAAA